MAPAPTTRVIYFTLDTDRLLTNFDPAIHQEFIDLGQRLGLSYVGTASDPRQVEEENRQLKEQVRSLSVFNSLLSNTNSSVNEKMNEMAAVIIRDHQVEASSIANQDTTKDSIEVSNQKKTTKFKFTGTNSRQIGSDV